MSETVQIKLEGQPKCPVYGQGRVEDGRGYGTKFLGVELYYALCRICGNYWLVNRMTDEFTDEYYETIYRKITSPTEEMKERNVEFENLRAQYQLEFLRQHHIDGKVVLDVGCSLGILIQKLKDELDCTVFGVDKNKTSGIPWILSDISAVEDESVDVLILSHVLEHQNHPLKFLQDSMKKLKPGGKVLLDMPNSNVDPQSFRLHHPIGMTWAGLQYFIGLLGLEIEDTLWYDPFSTPILISMMVYLNS